MVAMNELLEEERQATAKESVDAYYTQYGRGSLGGYLAPVEVDPEYAERTQRIWLRYFCKPITERSGYV